MTLTASDRAAAAHGTDPGVVRRTVPVLLPSFVMAGMGFWGIGLGSALSNDETATMWAGRYLSVHRLWHLLGNVDAVQGFYYLFVHGWSHIVGGSPAALRIPSVLALSAAAAVLAAIGRRLTGSPAVGLCAGLIMALTPSVSYYAQTARSYALVYLCVVIATLALLRALDAEQREVAAARVRRWVLYAAAVTVVGYLNELALAFVVAHGVTLLWARVSRRTALHWLAASLAGALLVVPLVVVSTGQTGQVTWLIVPDTDSVLDVFHMYFGASTLIGALLLGLAVVGASAWRREAHHEPGKITLTAVALPLLIGPAVVLALASVILRPLFDARYVFYGEAGAALLVAGGAVALARRISRVQIRSAAVPALCVAVFAEQFADQQDQRDPISRGGYGEVAAFVSAHAAPGDGVVFIQDFYRKIKLAYPERFRDVVDLTIDIPPAVTGDFWGRDLPLPELRSRLRNHHRVWTVGLWTAPGEPTLGRALHGRWALRVLRARFQPIGSERIASLAITLWVRRTPAS